MYQNWSTQSASLTSWLSLTLCPSWKKSAENDVNIYLMFQQPASSPNLHGHQKSRQICLGQVAKAQLLRGLCYLNSRGLVHGRLDATSVIFQATWDNGLRLYSKGTWNLYGFYSRMMAMAMYSRFFFLNRLSLQASSTNPGTSCSKKRDFQEARPKTLCLHAFLPDRRRWRSSTVMFCWRVTEPWTFRSGCCRVQVFKALWWSLWCCNISI